MFMRPQGFFNVLLTKNYTVDCLSVSITNYYKFSYNLLVSRAVFETLSKEFDLV